MASLPAARVEEALARIRAMIEEGVDRMKTDAGDAPLIAVGGGSFLVPPRLAGVSEVLNVPHQAVANAVGAAIAQVSGEVDQIPDLTRRGDSPGAGQRDKRWRPRARAPSTWWRLRTAAGLLPQLAAPRSGVGEIAR